MKTPPLLLGATLICWAARNDHWVAGPLLAVLLEAPHLVKARFDFSLSDFSRVWDLCTILFLGAAFYCYMTVEAVKAIFTFTEWTPIIFAPIVLAHAFSTSPLLPGAVFSWFLRQQKNQAPQPAINPGLFYFVVGVIATSSSNVRTPWLFPALAVLIGWCLWFFRPARSIRLIWVVLFLSFASGSYYIETHLNQVQTIFEARISDLIGRFGRRVPDASESRTQIGSVGRLQLSHRIAFRVRAKGKAPELLREASYIRYADGLWAATSRNDFAQVKPENGSSWVFSAHQTNFTSVTISMELPGGHAVLPLPAGSFRLDELPANLMDTNSLGAVRVLDGPGFASYEAHYTPNTVLDAVPSGDTDFGVPEGEERLLDMVVAKLGLRGKHLPEAMTILQNYFFKEFTYSTYQPAVVHFYHQRGLDSPLAEFLLRRKSGHCEYFATATTLLLRRAGFPARYAVGYAIEPGVNSDGEHVVRERDAHAWCLVYVNHNWVDFDTTPGNWEVIERQRAHIWEPFYDFASNLWYKFSRWRWLGSRDEMLYLIWIFVPLTALMIWRILSAIQRQKTVKNSGLAGRQDPFPGLDSAFYQLEARLRLLGFERASHEPIRAWVRRIEAKLPRTLSSEKLAASVGLHYRYRFDPYGISRDEKANLARTVQECLRGLR